MDFLIFAACVLTVVAITTAATFVVMLWNHDEIDAYDEALSLRYSEGRITLDEWDASLSLFIDSLKDEGRYPPPTLGDSIVRFIRRR